MGSGFTGPPDHLRNPIDGHRPAVHRRTDAGPTMAELRERYGGRWDILTADNGSLLAVPSPREDGVKWLMVVSAWDCAGFATWLAEADRAMKEDR